MLTDFYDVIIQPDEYRFSPSGTYYAPPEGPLGSYAEYVNSLPYTEGPELFGLHDNANITCALGETNLLLNTVLSLQPRSGGGGGMSWDDQLAEVSADIEARLPAAYDIELALIQFPVRYDEAMNTVRISASRRVAAVSLRSDDSSPRIRALGRFFSDFEWIRTAFGRLRGATGESLRAGPANGRRRSDAAARLLASRRRLLCVSGRLSGPRAAAPSVRGVRTPCGVVVARPAVEATSARRRGGGGSPHGRAIAEKGSPDSPFGLRTGTHARATALQQPHGPHQGHAERSTARHQGVSRDVRRARDDGQLHGHR